METDQRTQFLHAQRFERELNPRQRDIIQRLARGQTNAEIAAALDMTFDGAKWNVSEILSKLGLSSREEAADYWRWRQSPRTKVRAAMRALIPAGLPGKVAVAGGAATLVAVVAVVAFLFARDGDSKTVAATPPFRLEANVVVGNSDGSIVPSRVIWEWEDSTHYRYDLLVWDPEGGQHLYTVVADGSRLWSGENSAPTYSNAPLPAVDVDSPPALPISLLIGPAPARSIDALLDLLRARTAPGDPANAPFARMAGEEEILGVRTVIIEAGPVWLSQEIGFGDTNGPPPSSAMRSGGVIRVWVDPSTMFILRSEDQAQGQSTTADIVSLEYGVRFSEGDFQFNTQPGKTEVRE